MRNGKYDVQPEDWQKLDSDQKLWLIFNTFNGQRYDCSCRFKRHERAIVVLFILLISLITGIDKIPAWALKFFGVM
uniref:Uncharacterized protein n=1 Tax=viral metagenome TaxID=1070528 RepID=A0A6H1ZJQ1_9ZZZZ